MSFEYVLLKDSDVFTKSDQYIAIFSGENPLLQNSIGFPGKEGFGVGLAPVDILPTLHLKELPYTRDRASYQYGLYEYEQPADDIMTIDPDGQITVNGVAQHSENTASAASDEEFSESVPIKPTTPAESTVSKSITQSYRAYFKYIPRFYVCLLSRSDEVLMTAEELTNLLPYVAVTLEQMQEAQNRAGTAALVISKPEAFGTKEEAMLHGFMPLDAFIDNSKEVDGFFVQNTLPMFYSSTDGINADTLYCFGHPSFKFQPRYLYENQTNGIVRCDATNPPKIFDLAPNQKLPAHISKKFPGCNLETVHMRAALRVLEFCQMLYDTPSWGKSVKGINTNGSTDAEDASIIANTSVSTKSGDCWTQDADMYLKTTHNGQVNGITNLNGWVYQMLLGADSSWKKIMTRDRKLSEVTLEDALADGGVAAPEVENDATWGQVPYNQPWYRGDPHLFGVIPYKSSCQTNPTDIFGNDTFRHIDGYQIAAVGRCFKDGESAGIFASLYGSNFENTSSLVSFRLALYPDGNDTMISIIPDMQGGVGSKVVQVAKESVWKDVKTLLAEPTFEGKKFKHWSLSVNGDEIKDDYVFIKNTVISVVWI